MIKELLGKKVQLELEGLVIAFDYIENKILVQFGGHKAWFHLDRVKKVMENN